MSATFLAMFALPAMALADTPNHGDDPLENPAQASLSQPTTPNAPNTATRPSSRTNPGEARPASAAPRGPGEPVPGMRLSEAVPAATAARVARDAAEAARVAEAKVILARGKSLFAAGHYDGALSEFLRAHEILEGHARQAVVLNNIAVCHERLYRYADAIAYYERYLREANPDTSDRAEVKAVIRTLRGLLATLTIDSNVPLKVWVNNRQAGQAPGALRMPPGRHVLEFRAPGHEPRRLEVLVSAREHRRLTVDLTAVNSFKGLEPDLFYVSAGATAALALGAVVLGGYTLSEKYRFEDLATAKGGIQDEHLVDLQGKIHTLETASNVAWLAVGLASATTLVISLLCDWDARDTAPGLDVAIGGRSASVRMSGVFP